MEGMAALTVPAGPHPFLDGLVRVTVAGIPDTPRVRDEDGFVSIEAEGLQLRFEGAVVSTDGDEIRVRPTAVR